MIDAELHEPQCDLAQILGRAHALRTLAQAFRLAEDVGSLRAALSAWQQRSGGALADALERARRGLEIAPELLSEEYDRLLSGRGGVAVRELSYADPRHLAPTELIDVAGFMAAFGLQSTAAPPDHVASECELASWLSLKEGYAASECWTERQEISRAAYERLFSAHLVRWLPRFAARLRAASVLEFYLAMADVLELFLRAEAERLDVAVVDVDREQLPLFDDEPGCAGCPGVGSDCA